MRGWVRTGALTGWYLLTVCALRVGGFHTRETFATAVVGAVSVGLLTGCLCHAWDERKRRAAATPAADAQHEGG